MFAQPAQADVDLISPETLFAEADVRLIAAGGERSWTDGGFGKARFGETGDGRVIRPVLAGADLVWRPRFGWIASALVSGTVQHDQDKAVDLNEAFVRLKPVPRGHTRVAARLGLLYPPVSLEHGGPAWSVTHTTTPSAINSWIGEEVKVAAAEATVAHRAGDHELSVTGALFGFNDTSGTLLSYRGWALHDLKATAFGRLPLPPLARSVARFQAPHSNPVYELDDRLGYYARLDWRPPAPVSLNLFRYDNRGDRVSSRNHQTAWDTRFWNVGATVEVDDRTTLFAQALWGVTLVGPDTPAGVPLDVSYASAYLLGVREIGAGSLAGRVDWFRTSGRKFGQRNRDYDESGWAATIAYRRPLAPYATLFLEGLHVSSDRNGRRHGGIEPQQAQTLVQTSLRLSL